MAYENVDEFGGSIGVEGQVYPFVPNSIETGIIQNDDNRVGGFVLFTAPTLNNKVWSDNLGEIPAEFASNAYPIGVAQFTSIKEKFEKGDLVNIVKKGRVLVKAGDTMLSNATVAVRLDENNKAYFVTVSNNEIDCERFKVPCIAKTNGNAGDLVEIELG